MTPITQTAPTPPLPILAAGPGWVAVDKTCHMSVHNNPGQDVCSILTAAIKTTPDLQQTIDLDAAFGIHPVHRLDRDTSGVILLAGQKDIFTQLAAQFEKRRVKKAYVALVHGRIGPEGSIGETGFWEWPLSPKPGGRNNPAGSGAKQPCRTAFRSLAHSPHYTLIECEPLTGRRHQIRRHAKLAGHAIVGDRRYATKRALDFLKNQLGFNRLALHARALALTLPGQNNASTIRTDRLPKEIEALFTADG
jgi:RluA family pseudouridine synthase